MTEKFKNLSKEMAKLCTKTNNVKTRKQARALSLQKWLSLKNMALIFFSEFNVRCGFCGYGEFKAKETDTDPRSGGRCLCCGVKTICNDMMEKHQNLEDEGMALIDGLITHFEEMKV